MLDENEKLIRYNETTLYKEDLIGLKELNENGKVEFVALYGEHMEYTMEELDNYVIPPLL
jgi:palmitoyl-protein thioesterase